MKLRVKVNVSKWAWGDGDESNVLLGGTHTLEGNDLSKDFVQALAAAAEADPGTIEILSSDDAAKKAMSGGVESDSDSLKALAKAQEDGAGTSRTSRPRSLSLTVSRPRPRRISRTSFLVSGKA
nr:hypothetical protein [Actinomycetota bacterium]